MVRRWTEEQLEAINNRASNLLVSAAAGSGKTAVLIERIIQIVTEEKIDIDRLLVVTFTRAAAAEMRQRAADALINRLSSSTIDEGFIRRQLDRLNQAYMMTFHSFCIEVIKNHYYLINMDASFKTVDQATGILLREEAMEELFEYQYEEANPLFHRLIEMYCQHYDDRGLKEIILEVYQFSRSHPEPGAWIGMQAEKFNMSVEAVKESDWLQSLKKDASMVLTGLAAVMEEALMTAKKPSGPTTYVPLLAKELNDINNVMDLLENDMDSMITALHGIEFRRLPPAKNVDETIREEVKELRNQVKKDVVTLKDNWFYQTAHMFAIDHHALSAPMSYLVGLVHSFHQLYNDKKKSRNLLDFNDLEHYALKILEDPTARQFYQQHFVGIYIDEYQDSNRVQETLVNKIKRDNNVFMVGDVKQSIYRFRLAEPEMFMEKHKTYQLHQGGLHQRIDLNRNFRSQSNIIKAVNTVFSNIMSETLGEIIYDATAELKSGIDIEEGSESSLVDVHLIETMQEELENMDTTPNKNMVDLDLLNEWNRQELEAICIVHQIKNLMKTRIKDHDTDQLREVNYRDIAILLRAPGNQAPVFLDIFSQEGIPVYGDVSAGFYDSLEIKMVLDLLQVLDNIHNDVPLLSVLRSPFGQFSIEELTQIRLMDQSSSFADVLLQTGEDRSLLGEKAADFIQKITEWRRVSRTMSLSDFIWWVMSETNYYVLCAAMPGGEQRRANLRMLTKYAYEFSQNTEGDMFQFLYYINRTKFSRQSDYGPARTLNESDDVIRLMSIHKSKGLEFPVVIVAGLGKGLNRRDLHQPLLLHKDLGMGPMYVDPELRIRRHTLARIAIREKLRRESLSEEMRVLYVAMTRAQQKLILTGAVKNLPRQVMKWRQSTSEGHRLKASSLLDWLGPVWVSGDHSEVLSVQGCERTPVSGIDSGTGDALWNFHCWNRLSLSMGPEAEGKADYQLSQLLKESKSMDGDQTYQLFDKRFNWVYPHITDTETNAKISVSQLTKHQDVQAMFHRTPIRTPGVHVDGPAGLSPAERGTALHYVMQNIDTRKVADIAQINLEIKSMVKRKMLTEDEAQEMPVDRIVTFFSSSLGQRFLLASTAFRELPFVMKNPANPKMLVQGIIDCCFVEKKAWVIVDYKTDRTDERDIESWAGTYLPQLTLYKQALESITQVPVSEVYLYAFSISREIRVL